MHVTYSTLLKKDPELFYELNYNWTKISTVRNPWDHAVSRYFHLINVNRIHKERRRHTLEQLSSFEYFLENKYNPQDDFTFNCENFMVDHWFKFETLDENWKEFSEKLNFKSKTLVKHNIGRLSKNYYDYQKPQDYHDMYTNDRMIEIVFEKSQKTIEYFGYTFQFD